ncbi:MAG: argininosuccinate lyase [Acidobacteria bacterium]|nr:argininosuccinate lyase [Acidobacteriota bacterium]MBI3264771.1 argininosuccinate lyase [Acidobacteriota bacterium]
MTLWSGRFDTAPDEDAFQFGVSLRFDRRLFREDVEGSLAWVETLAKIDVLTRTDAVALTAALDDILEHGTRDPSFLDGPDEDIHSFVERQLVERVGEAGKRLHTGRSRNEQVSLDLRLYLKRRIRALRSLVLDLASALLDQAERAGEALMPAYTHTRRAQPVLVAHFFLAHVAAMQRDVDRLAEAIKEADVLPLGSGAIAGTSYEIDTEALAARLGFSRVVANSLDASSDRDFVSSFLHACALAMMHLSRLAADLILFSGEEYRFFDLADASATGSSMMPQKKNPDPLELARGKTGRVVGHLVGWLTTMKGLPSGYNRDLQEDKEAVFDTEDTLAAALRASRSVVAGLQLDAARTAHAASGLLLATEVADYLVARGMPFRQAHEVVGALARRLVGEGRDFGALSLDEWRRASGLFGDDIQTRVRPEASVRARRTPQSTHPAAVAASLARARAWLAACRGDALPGR